MDYGHDLGIITLIETDKGHKLYFVQWMSGGLTGYTTAQRQKEIEIWSKNVRLI